MNFAAFNQTSTLASPARTFFGVRFSATAANVALLFLTAVLGVWYLSAVNSSMSKRYEVRETQKEVSRLEAVVRSNQAKLSELNTVGNLTAQAQSIGMVPAGTAEYVTRFNSGLSLR
jgi:uncharacterized membrane-anchored protein